MPCTITGIYKIEINDKVYIGQSKDIHRRWKHHRNLLKRIAHDNPHMQNLFNKYGESSLKFSILEECLNLSEREAFWIETVEPRFRLNLHAVADVIPVSLETRIRISEAKKGKPLSEAHKEKLSISHIDQVSWNKGKKTKPISKEHKLKISKANKGRVLKFSDEHKLNISKSWEKRRLIPVSQDTKNKLSQASKESWKKRNGENT